MPAVRFHIGDRVKAGTSRVVPAGTRGTIQDILRSVPDMYYVRFEGLARPHLMYARELERIEDTMIVTCATVEAAVQVLAVLIDAGLSAGRDFHTAVSVPFGPPITSTILVALPSEVLRQLRTIPDTTIT